MDQPKGLTYQKETIRKLAEDQKSGNSPQEAEAPRGPFTTGCPASANATPPCPPAGAADAADGAAGTPEQQD